MWSAKQNHTVTRSVARSGKLEEPVNMQTQNHNWQLEFTKQNLFTTHGKTKITLDLTFGVTFLKSLNALLTGWSRPKTCNRHAAQRPTQGTKFIDEFYKQSVHMQSISQNMQKGNPVSKLLPVQSSRHIHQQLKGMSSCENHAKLKSNCCSHQKHQNKLVLQLHQTKIRHTW